MRKRERQRKKKEGYKVEDMCILQRISDGEFLDNLYKKKRTDVIDH